MGSNNSRIFLVDDNIINLNAGKNVLQHRYNVVTIPSGEKLLQTLERVKPDLILLDVEMPGLNGYDTIKKLKANSDTAPIPVIFLTGKSDTNDELLGLQLGAVDYIAKPFSPPLLLKRIELHLLLQKQQNELKNFNDNLIQLVKERTEDVTALQNAVIIWAAEMVEFRDEETGHHIERVQKYLQILLEAMSLSERYAAEISSWDIEAFLKSALLHDVGKIRIRDEILLKKGKLTDDEYSTMKQHANYGKILLENLQELVPNQAFLDYAKTLAHRHHERWDGTGYPDNLKGDEIPLQARMMAIADVYDALISERPYKKALSHEEGLQIIKDSRGTHFDPNLTDLFVSLSDKIKDVSEAVKLGKTQTAQFTKIK
ncbi:MAG: response regulator [Clostridiales bacterium]|jgi:putative two-component system response regulator|nr:response regulator [Clostridiales bacterium]